MCVSIVRFLQIIFPTRTLASVKKKEFYRTHAIIHTMLLGHGTVVHFSMLHNMHVKFALVFY